MCWRLRRRRKYDGLSVFLRALRLSDADVARLVGESGRFPEFCEAIGVVLEQCDSFDLSQGGFSTSAGALDTQSNMIKLGRLRKGQFVLTDSGFVKWTGDWAELVSEQYLVFREVLLDERAQ